MRKSNLWLILPLLFFLVLSLSPARGVSARPAHQTSITSPSQLIDAVNNLRLAYGLRPLAVHQILMQTAQGQADYMAAIGSWTHSRPGGMTYTQQLISLGFPLAGDLSLGGFRAENVLMQSNPLVWDGVPSAWQDPDHMNTMLSQNFTNIGAGISQGTNGYFYAVDCAATTGSGQMQGDASSILTSVPGAGTSEANSAGISQFMVPVVKSTARPDGDVFHKVQYGQTLWSIAIAYGTTIKNIQGLNNLGNDLIVYQGQELLVKKGATQPAPATPTHAAPGASPVTQTMVPTSSPTFAMPTIAFPPSATPVSSQAALSSSRLLVVILIVGAFVGAGMAVWLIRDPRG
jgi:uncharacterized protein YkwD/LysM repeat protein